MRIFKTHNSQHPIDTARCTSNTVETPSQPHQHSLEALVLAAHPFVLVAAALSLALVRRDVGAAVCGWGDAITYLCVFMYLCVLVCAYVCVVCVCVCYMPCTAHGNVLVCCLHVFSASGRPLCVRCAPRNCDTSQSCLLCQHAVFSPCSCTLCCVTSCTVAPTPCHTVHKPCCVPRSLEARPSSGSHSSETAAAVRCLHRAPG